jgi:hypothetical protein
VFPQTVCEVGPRPAGLSSNFFTLIVSAAARSRGREVARDGNAGRSQRLGDAIVPGGLGARFACRKRQD